MTAPDLKPCPFCGATADDVHLSHVTGRIFCEGCGAEGPWSPFFDGDWNTRSDLIPAMIAEAEQRGREEGIIKGMHIALTTPIEQVPDAIAAAIRARGDT